MGREEVCGPSILSPSLISLTDQVNLELSMEVSDISVSFCMPLSNMLARRAQYRR
jgi:hypothetical protein